MAEKTKQKKLIANIFTGKQFFWFILGLLFAGTGLALLIMYYMQAYSPLYSDLRETLSNALETFNSVTYTSFGFIGWGIIAFIIGAFIIAGALSFAAKIEDKEKDRKARRELRIEAMKKALATDQSSVIDQVIESGETVTVAAPIATEEVAPTIEVSAPVVEETPIETPVEEPTPTEETPVEETPTETEKEEN